MPRTRNLISAAANLIASAANLSFVDQYVRSVTDHRVETDRAADRCAGC